MSILLLLTHRCHITDTPQQFEYGHVVCAERFTGLAGSHDITDKRGPVPRPLLLHNLQGRNTTVTHLDEIVLNIRAATIYRMSLCHDIK